MVSLLVETIGMSKAPVYRMFTFRNIPCVSDKKVVRPCLGDSVSAFVFCIVESEGDYTLNPRLQKPKLWTLEDTTD